MTSARDRLGRSPHLIQDCDCMVRSEFHRLYSEIPEGYRAELLDGIAYEPLTVPSTRQPLAVSTLIYEPASR